MKNRKFKFINFYTVLCCVFTLCIVIGGISFSILYPDTEKPVKIVESVKKQKKVTPKKVELKHFEIYPDEIDLSSPLDLEVDKSIKKGLPKVAIIIDDIGFDKKIAMDLMNLGIPVTLSVLPYSPFGDSIAFNAREKDFELMLHLPMEPFEYPRIDPGPGALLTSMGKKELVDLLYKNLAEIPYIKGVNNHMGSKMTSDKYRMGIILSEIKNSSLYYIDSRTSKNSVCAGVAESLKFPFGERDVFLDHTQDEESINIQFDKLIEVAEKKGWAIGIGHPHYSTLNVLTQKVPDVKKRVLFVSASKIIDKSYHHPEEE